MLDINSLNREEPTSTWGLGKSEGIQQQQRLEMEYTRRSRVILKSKVNAKNKITAIGALAIPVLKYSFCIINWKLEGIKKLTGKLDKS
jgi:hypothetical protein